MPKDLYGFLAFFIVPPGPPFPEEIHLQNMCGIVWCYTGDLDRHTEALAPARDPAPPAFEFTTPMPYPVLQSMFDALYPPGLQWYWRGDFFERISDEAIDAHLKYGGSVPSMRSAMHLYPVDGAVQRVGAQDTAWSHRDATWSGVIVGVQPEHPPGLPRGFRTVRRSTLTSGFIRAGVRQRPWKDVAPRSGRRSGCSQVREEEWTA